MTGIVGILGEITCGYKQTIAALGHFANKLFLNNVVHILQRLQSRQEQGINESC